VSKRHLRRRGEPFHVLREVGAEFGIGGFGRNACLDDGERLHHSRQTLSYDGIVSVQAACQRLPVEHLLAQVFLDQSLAFQGIGRASPLAHEVPFEPVDERGIHDDSVRRFFARRPCQHRVRGKQQTADHHEVDQWLPDQQSQYA
jgi:hypothetical protein